MSTTKKHLRTLYITGLPDGVTNEELDGLFKDDWTYEGAVIKQIGTRLVAYAKFTTHEDALRAKQEFDVGLMATSSKVRLEWARQNSRVPPQLYHRLVQH